MMEISNRNRDSNGIPFTTIEELSSYHQNKILYCLGCKKELTTDDIYDIDDMTINFCCQSCKIEFALYCNLADYRDSACERY